MIARTLKDRVAEELSHLPDLTRAELLEHWEKDYGKPAPKGISRRLLEYSAAYKIQVKAFGGLNAPAKRKLAHYAQKDREPSKAKTPTRKTKRLSPGTRLVREWHGKSHHVEVIENGFLYDGRTWRSLSQIARDITGARWSGPRFFGL